jgi:NAD(P)-dependent dehydrogenase (short-subunit alcohol dehydrogenase family)
MTGRGKEQPPAARVDEPSAAAAWLNLSGRRIVVTGGASGMGAGLVEALPDLGASVVSLDRDVTAGQAVAQIARVHFVGCDVGDPESVAGSIREAVDLLGGLDVLIHAAGIAPRARAEETGLALWDDVMRVNATGTYLTNVAVRPYLKIAGGGAIVNFASIAGVEGLPGKAAYAASKGAAVAWMRTVAHEWGSDRIRINCVAPAIRTPMYERTRAQMDPAELSVHDAERARVIPLGGRLGDVERDLVPVVAFLASDASRFITGQIIAVDGGWLKVR